MNSEPNLDSLDESQNRNEIYRCGFCHKRLKSRTSNQHECSETEEKQRKKQVQRNDQAATGINLNINADTCASVNAPLMIGNTFKKEVYICPSINEKQEPSETAEERREKQNRLRLQFLKTHKTKMKKKAKYIFEYKNDKEVHLKDVYTELFITEGDMKDVNHEHEIQQIDDALKTQNSQDRQINCNDIFTSLSRKNEEKIVLTKGIAGIGKTVSVHKFILDWAEEEANQEIECVFLLPFRYINLMTNKELSLHEFLVKFYPELKDLDEAMLYKECKLAFIFDGLDESRLPLNFKSSFLNTVDERASVDVLFTSLVKGTLLPSALIWVTSRPAAANLIPPEYVGLFTEVRGFTDEQKEEYFRKRITDESLASIIISHIKKSRSLYIMCHIPVFCSITAIVLQDILKNNTENISTTLTEMYIHFLLIQMKIKNRKYDEQEERERIKLLGSNREMLLKLAKLAFEQLKRENVVFYEDDLEECDIRVNVATEFTGMIAEIFKEEYGLHETKFFCFVHLSVQEFLAALHVFICYLNKNMQELQFFFDEPKENVTLQEILQKAVDKAIKSDKGHLDLFLRFLMGISLKSSQNLLKGLFTYPEASTESTTQIAEYIKLVQNEYNISDERSVNLFYCLLELKDHSLYEEILSYLSSDKHPGKKLSSSMCTVLTSVLLMSEKVLDEFNPKKFTSSQTDYNRLIPAMRCCRKALFDNCGLDETCCGTVSSALQASNSHLVELDLSSNNLGDSGVKLLELERLHCQLKILRICGCNLTALSCTSLSSALESPNSHLNVLDLSNNDLQDSGVELLSEGLKSPNCQLTILRCSICYLTAHSCGSLSSVLQSSNYVLRELDLSNNDLQDSGVKILSEGLKNPNFQLKILRLSGCMVTEEGCHYLSSALTSNPSHLIELDLSYNYPGDSGVKLLSEKLQDPNCKLDKLNVDHGGESRIIAGLKKYACFLTLDQNTANTQLNLSEEKRKVTCLDEKQSYPDHPDRFDVYPQVLCTESFYGRCYWEIEWSGDDGVYIAVSYKSISRKGDGDEQWFGCNDQSWSLICCPDRYSFRHNKIVTCLSVKPISRRIGVYVDHSAGTLSFYSVSDTVSLIHTIQTTFTQPLCPGFKIYYKSSVKLF
ncbi:NACHT, LRR and PYD domains-containing protein 3-like isoform X1 [Carassius auratus]|uniref:NACHT, LRR and PYD domains-containing protein 3-like isoform X1 n=1 Tax=Carassius auratus TaxID=7957 RepID=A0A6P6P069_CARAU|nr:NACHT, LRR and PYD domains-containing protein 3-like isoform X1 [Carassius auratus]